jgi:hypothetical protein
MYGICGQRSDGKVLNCVNATKAVKVTTRCLVHTQFEYNVVGQNCQSWHCIIFLYSNVVRYTCLPNDFYNFPAEQFVFYEDPKFVLNNHWRCLLYGRSI